MKCVWRGTNELLFPWKKEIFDLQSGREVTEAAGTGVGQWWSHGAGRCSGKAFLGELGKAHGALEEEARSHFTWRWLI